MKNLVDLVPEFIGVTRPPAGGEGMTLVCPACGPKHILAVYFKNPVDGLAPAKWHEQTWMRHGEALGKITIEPSIKYPCWHGWIENGIVYDISEGLTVDKVILLVLGLMTPEQSAAIPESQVALSPAQCAIVIPILERQKQDLEAKKKARL